MLLRTREVKVTNHFQCLAQFYLLKEEKRKEKIFQFESHFGRQTWEESTLLLLKDFSPTEMFLSFRPNGDTPVDWLGGQGFPRAAEWAGWCPRAPSRGSEQPSSYHHFPKQTKQHNQKSRMSNRGPFLDCQLLHRQDEKISDQMSSPKLGLRRRQHWGADPWPTQFLCSPKRDTEKEKKNLVSLKYKKQDFFLTKCYIKSSNPTLT